MNTHIQELEERLQERRYALQEVEDDLAIQRQNKGDLGPLYIMLNEIRQEVRQLEQQLAGHRQQQQPREMQYDKQSLLANSVVFRKNVKPAESISRDDKTSQGDCYKVRKPIKSPSRNAQTKSAAK